MASDDKKAKTNPAPKTEAPPKKEAAATKKDANQPTSKSPSAAEPAKAVAVEKTAEVPSGYSRGEGQKPVSQAYKDNWDAIYGKKKKKR